MHSDDAVFRDDELRQRVRQELRRFSMGFYPPVIQRLTQQRKKVC